MFFEKENITQDAANSEVHFKREICKNSINYIMSMNLSDFLFVVIKGVKPVT